MAAATRYLASAAVGGLMVVGAATASSAQTHGRQPVPPVSRVASFAPGGIAGFVLDDLGAPLAGAVVSALGATTTVAVTDKDGRFVFGALSPGPYLIRAHLAGYAAPRAQMVQVGPSAQSASSIALRRLSAPPVLAAGFGGANAAPVPAAPETVPTAEVATDAESTQREIVWRIKHARRGVLKEITFPTDLVLVEDGDRPGALGGTPMDFFGRAVGSPARVASAFFLDTPFSGQVNLLTTGSFDHPQELLSTDAAPRSVAFARVSAPVGDRADWTVSGALTQADLSAWTVAGSYTTRAPARHRYDVGLSYSTQRYDGGNLLALRDLADGSRNVGTVFGYDSFSVVPALTLQYGASYARYDYLDNRSLWSPRAEMTLSPAETFRISAAVARRELAPGAEEFLPPGDDGFWLPPQRTFSSIDPERRFQTERAAHAEVAVERDFGGSTLAVRAFRQHVDDQLIAVFGTEVPGQPASKVGHYLVGNSGDIDASGYGAALRTVVAGRVHSSFEYSLSRAILTGSNDPNYLLLLAPSANRVSTEHLHNFDATLETTVPETATRVLVLYRVSNGFARPAGGDEAPRPGLDGRFDVQVRQSLPFMNFSNARWEMLLAVRNFFREASTEQSLYDELMVVRPPKRVVCGVALRF